MFQRILFLRAQVKKLLEKFKIMLEPEFQMYLSKHLQLAVLMRQLVRQKIVVVVSHRQRAMEHLLLM